MITPFGLFDSMRSGMRQGPVQGPMMVKGCKLLTGNVAARCEEAALTTKLTPHPNVALFRHAVPVAKDNCRGQYLASLAYSETLSERFQANVNSGNCFTEEYRKCILSQVTHGVHHIHEHGLVHGHIRPENVLLPVPGIKGDHLILSDLFPATTEGKSAADDMKQLTSLYYFVLTNGKHGTCERDQVDVDDLICKEPEIARSMLVQMSTGTATACDVLRHPFFWSDDKKLNFLLRSYDIIEYSENTTKLKQKLNENLDGSIFLNSWIDELRLTSVEVDMCREVAGSNNVSVTVVRDRAAKKHKGEEKAKSVWELYRFIRIMKVHFTEMGIPMSIAFQNNETSGLWNFFSRRFPKFFCRVHDVMNEYHLLEKGGVKEIYLEKSCPNACLPPLGSMPVDTFRQRFMPVERS